MWSARSNFRRGVFLAAVCCSLGLSSAHATSSNIQSQICRPFAQPTISAPATGTTAEDIAIHITGTAEPGITVVILRNGNGIGASTAASDGTFGLEAPLAGGSNSFVARTTNACNTVHDSAAVTVVRAMPGEPQPTEPPTPQEPIVGLPDIPQNPSQTPSRPAAGDQPLITPEAPATGLQAPTITKPRTNQTVSTKRLWISGSAPVGSAVVIVLNDTAIAHVTTSEEGTFAALVGLQEGHNDIQAYATQDGLTSATDQLIITYTPSDKATPGTQQEKPKNTIGPAVAVAAGGLTLTGISLYGGFAAFHWAAPRIRKIFK